jgi:hypothetical protein
MAMSTTNELESVEEPVLRQFHPKPFHWDAVDPEKVVISYDRRSDTLLVHLFGRGRSSVSVHIDRYLYAMVDPESEEIIGVHIEGFLSQAVKEHPQEIVILDHAELRGITSIEVRALQREVLRSQRQQAQWLPAIRALSSSFDRSRAVALLLAAEEKERWGIPDTSAA